jgi:hypothetical protein
MLARMCNYRHREAIKIPGGFMFSLFNGIISVYTKNVGILMELMTQVQDNLVTMYQNGTDHYFFEVSRLNEVQLNYLKKHFEIDVIANV